MDITSLPFETVRRSGQTPKETRRRARYNRAMKLAVCLSFAVMITAPATAAAAAEQCRFIEARSEREVCYQRQEAARAARQKAEAERQVTQPKPYEPMAPEDAQLTKSLRGICRGC